MQLKFIEAEDGVSHVVLSGKLDVMGLHEVDIKFHAYTAGRKKPAIIDMADVDFIASLGMGMLISCAQSLTRNGAQMVLVNPQAMVKETLNTAGIGKIIPIVATVDEARELINRP